MQLQSPQITQLRKDIITVSLPMSPVLYLISELAASTIKKKPLLVYFAKQMLKGILDIHHLEHKKLVSIYTKCKKPTLLAEAVYTSSTHQCLVGVDNITKDVH